MRMEFITWFFSITTLTIFCSISIPVHSKCLEDQKSLLLQLKNSLQFNQNSSVKLVSWAQSNDCCQWNGVTCDHFGRVIGLDLNTESISRGLNDSSSLFGLKFLEKLNLAYNRFNSTRIPSSFGVLTNLKYLNLSAAEFEGQIPMQFSRLTRLVKLDLSENWYLRIEKTNLFTLFRNLGGLVELYLDGVNISANGYEWGQAISSSLPNLRVLSLSDCLLSGPIDSSLQNLQYLSEINLAWNNLLSPVPDFFANFLNLTVLILMETNLYGMLPESIFQWVQTLETLDLSGNTLLNGSLPDFQENGSLQNLLLSYTSFSGNLPESLGDLMELRRMEIRGCNFSGPIPNSLANLSQLNYLDFSINNFIGPIPSFQRSKNLTYIDLSGNSLTGPIPSFQGSKHLTSIDLSQNSLTGPIPSFQGSKHLTSIDLSQNSLTGPIPSFQGSKHLTSIYLSQNSLTGPIPSFQGSKHLTSIDLSHNALTGPIPSIYFEGLSNLEDISLENNSFHGSIPSSLFSCPSLEDILISNNQFSEVSGFLPNGTLSPLNTLDLSSNKLQGPIPSYFFDFESLSSLDLSSNNFSGTLQLESFHRLQNLMELKLSYNSLSVNASISNSNLSFFPELRTLGLASCKLQEFPPLMNQSLSELDLSDNQISGVIPNWVWNIVNGSLSSLNLSCNLLVGLQSEYRIPDNLDVLDLHSNQLHGEIPLSFASRFYVDYSWNNFSSSLSVEIGKFIASAQFFSLSYNMLSGPIPPSICNGSNLEVLDLSNNRFTGTIPRCLIDKGTVNLSVLNLQNNQLIGKIIGTFPEGCALRTLNLNANCLEGQVPKSLANCANAEVLNLGTNKINGNFPCFLANLSNLRVLVLRSNKFHGNIPCSGILNNMWPKLQIIDLALNNFSGILPPKFFSQRKAMMDAGNGQPILSHLRFGMDRNIYYGGRTPYYRGANPYSRGIDRIGSFRMQRSNKNFGMGRNIYYEDSVTVIIKGLQMKLVKILTIFTAIDFSNNSFEGKVPNTVGDLKSLYALNLSHNALTGSIPSSLGNLSKLESLDLSWNKLDGRIPVTLASLTFLSFLNLSYNQLTGMIPRGPQLQTFSKTSFEGNKGLWGPPLTSCCKEAKSAPPTLNVRRPTTEEDEINWVYIMATLGYTVGFGVIVGPLLYSKRWRQCYYKPVDRVIVRILHHREQRARNQRRRNNIN